jgi:hypothetical protein
MRDGAASDPPVRIEPGLLTYVTTLLGNPAPDRKVLAQTLRWVVATARTLRRSRAQKHVDAGARFTSKDAPLLAAMGFSGISIAAVDGPVVTVTVCELDLAAQPVSSGASIDVTYVMSEAADTVTAIDVSAPIESEDIVDPVTRGYDAAKRKYRFVFLRGGLSFLCVLSDVDGQWGSTLDVAMVEGLRFARSLFDNVPASPDGDSALDLIPAGGEFDDLPEVMARPDPADETILVGGATGTFLLVRRPAVFATAAEAAPPVLAGLPETEAVRAEGGRAPNLWLPAG